MLYVLLFTILNFSQSFSDTVEAKGTKGISYRAYVNQDTLYFQYKAGSKWSASIVIDNGDVASPSMAITSGDYLHIAWCNNGRICYRTNYQPITANSIKHDSNSVWSEKVFISPYFAEPASNISIAISGEYVKVTWQAPAEYDSTIDEKWQRRRWLQDVPNAWESPECLSKLSTKNQKN